MAVAEIAWLELTFAALLGLVVGSFLNVVIHRLPRGQSIVRPRSRCPACGVPIAAWDNLPLLSYLWLRGRCRHCAARISLRYPAIELVCALAFAALFLAHGPSLLTVFWWALAAALIAAAGIDLDEGFIPDEISLGGLALALTVLPVARVLAGDAAYGPALVHGVSGAALGAGSLWAVGFAHARISVALGRSFPHWPGAGESLPRPNSLDYWVWFPGLGFGDVKLLAMVGAFVGPVGVVFTILLASLFGLPLGFLLARGSSAGLASPFGFGPAIAAAALVVALLPPGTRWPGL